MSINHGMLTGKLAHVSWPARHEVEAGNNERDMPQDWDTVRCNMTERVARYRKIVRATRMPSTSKVGEVVPAKYGTKLYESTPNICRGIDEIEMPLAQTYKLRPRN